MKIIIAGGSGFIGSELVQHFEKQNHQVVVLGRNKENKTNVITWDGKTVGDWKQELKGTDVLINLTGKSVDCRYTEQNKKVIFDSRTNSIEVLEKAFNEINETPRIWIQAATATIYRDEYESNNDEYEGVIGEGFSVEVAKKWEETFDKVTLETKKVVLRMTIVQPFRPGYIFYRNSPLRYRSSSPPTFPAKLLLDDALPCILFIC